MAYHDQYLALLADLMDPERSVEEANERTGHRVRILRQGRHLSVDLADGRLPVPGTRRVYPRTAAAEVAWFVRGDRDVTWLARHAKIWSKFTEADGVTVDAAYGYRWRRHFGRDQLRLAVSALQEDPSDRRVYVSAWDPAQDGLGARGQRNVPCPVGFTLSLVEGRLNSTLLIRSSDVFVGLPYDVMGHSMLMEVVAATIGPSRCRGLGVLSVSLAHPHVYDSHYNMVRTSVLQDPVESRLRMVPMTLGQVEEAPDLFVAAYATLARATDWPSYNPLPELVL